MRLILNIQSCNTVYKSVIPPPLETGEFRTRIIDQGRQVSGKPSLHVCTVVENAYQGYTRLIYEILTILEWMVPQISIHWKLNSHTF